MEIFVFLFMIALSGASPIYKAFNNRVMNSAPAEENQFPYVISLQEINDFQNPTRGHKCGGALITYQHVLTTASCTFYNNSGVYTPINPAGFRIFAGSVTLTNDTSTDLVRSIANITVNPFFVTSRPYTNDIAIITLSSPFPEGIVTPVLMATPADDATTSSQRCRVAGWGAHNKTASASTQLMYVENTATDHALCAATHNQRNNKLTIDGNMVCATTVVTGATTSSGCVGDEGNPLECFMTSYTRGRLVGLLTKSNDCTSSDIPEVYTRVSSYYAWVNLVINNADTDTDTDTVTTAAPGAASIFQPGLAMLAILVFIANVIN